MVATFPLRISNQFVPPWTQQRNGIVNNSRFDLCIECNDALDRLSNAVYGHVSGLVLHVKAYRNLSATR